MDCSCHASRPTLAKRNCRWATTESVAGGPRRREALSRQLEVRAARRRRGQPVGKASSTRGGAAVAGAPAGVDAREERKQVPVALAQGGAQARRLLLRRRRRLQQCVAAGEGGRPNHSTHRRRASRMSLGPDQCRRA